MAKTSALQRSLKVMRAAGFTCGITEKWNPHARVRQDLFGFIDAVCIHSWQPIVGLQVVNTHLPEHIAKINTNPAAVVWKAAGGQIIVHSWMKRGPRGKPKTWQLSVTKL